MNNSVNKKPKKSKDTSKVNIQLDLIKKILLKESKIMNQIHKSSDNIIKIIKNDSPVYRPNHNKLSELIQKRDKILLKFPIPKNKKCEKLYKNSKLIFSNSMKNLEKKNFKTISVSPPKNTIENSKENLKISNSLICSPIINNKYKIELNIPKILNTESNKYTDKSNSLYNSNRRSSKEETLNFIYYTIYNNLLEINKNECSDPLIIIESFIKIFDNLSVNYDIKFRNINNILRTFSDSKNSIMNQKVEINALCEQINKLKDEIESINSLYKIQEIKCKKFYDKLKESEKTINCLKDENKEMKKQNNNQLGLLNERDSELENLKDNEKKLMKIIYHIHKKGYPIDDIINDQDSIMEDSNTTIYFPDKILSQTNKIYDLPKLDFRLINEQSQDSLKEDSKKEIPIRNIIQDIMSTNHDMNSKLEEYSNSSTYNYNKSV